MSPKPGSDPYLREDTIELTCEQMMRMIPKLTIVSLKYGF